MIKSGSLTVVAVFFAVVMGLFANSPSAEAKGNCEAKVLNKSYDCEFQDNDFGTFSECWEFFDGGVSQYFDVENGFDDYGCACDPKGSFNSTLFDSSSNALECSDEDEAFSYNVKISGNKLTVQGVGAEGEQYVAICRLRSSLCP